MPKRGRGGKRVGAGAPRGTRPSTIEKRRQQLVEHQVATIVKRNEDDPYTAPHPPRQVRSDSQLSPARRPAIALLEDMMYLLYGLSSHYQPKPGTIDQTTPQNRRLFNYYSKRFVDTAAKLAPYQSATLKAHAFMPPPLPAPTERPKGANIIDLTDQKAVAQHYRRVMMARKTA